MKRIGLVIMMLVIVFSLSGCKSEYETREVVENDLLTIEELELLEFPFSEVLD